MKTTRTILSTLSFLILGTLSATAQTYHATALPTLPGTSCYPSAINGSGAVAGFCSPDFLYNTVKAVVWQNGVLRQLGTLAGGSYAAATAINSLGTVVGDSDDGNVVPQAFVTFQGSLLNIDPQKSSNIRAVGITDSGAIFGNITKSGSGNVKSWYQVMWTVDRGHPDRYRETVLPKLQGGDPASVSAFLNASNNSGQAVGWVVNSAIGQQAGFWNNDSAHTVIALPSLVPMMMTIANGMNDLGQAVGNSQTWDSYGHAVLWQNDAAHSIVDLGMLPGDSEARGQAINNAGTVVGTSWSGTLSRAFVYQNGTMQDLATLIDPADGTFTISQATAINGAGQITAYGMSNGQPVALLLTPIAQ